MVRPSGQTVPPRAGQRGCGRDRLSRVRRVRLAAVGAPARGPPWHQSGLATLARRLPHWEIWRGTSGLLYARPAGTRDQPIVGEDPQDLADQITRAERLRGG